MMASLKAALVSPVLQCASWGGAGGLRGDCGAVFWWDIAWGGRAGARLPGLHRSR